MMMDSQHHASQPEVSQQRLPAHLNKVQSVYNIDRFAVGLSHFQPQSGCNTQPQYKQRSEGQRLTHLFRSSTSLLPTLGESTVTMRAA